MDVQDNDKDLQRRRSKATIADGGRDTRSSDRPPSNKLNATLEKRDKAQLGIGYRVVGEEELVITGILPSSPADDWNQTCDLEDVICTGDVILNVNNESSMRGMVDELLGSTVVFMQVLKAGPRWHIIGLAAESMDTAAQNLNSMRRDSTDDIDPTADEVPNLSFGQSVSVLAAVAVPNFLLCGLLSDMGVGPMFYGFLAPKRFDSMGGMVIMMSAMGLICLYVVDVTKWRHRYQQVMCMGTMIYAGCFGGVLKSRGNPQAPMVIILFHLPLFLGVLRARALKKVKRSKFYSRVASVLFGVGFGILALWLAWVIVPSFSGSNQWNDATKEKLAEKSKTIYDAWEVEVGGVTRSLDYNWDCSETSSPQPMDFVIDEYGRLNPTGHNKTVDEKSSIANACASVKTTWFLTYLSPLVAVGIDLVIFVFCIVNGVYLNVQDSSALEKAMKNFILMILILLLAMWVSVSVAGASMRLTGTILAFCVSGIAALFIWIYFEVGQRAVGNALRASKIMQTVVALATSDWVRACLVIALNVMIPTFCLINMLNQKVRKLRGLVQKDSGLFTEGTAKLMGSLRGWHWSGILIKANWITLVYWMFSIGVAKITYVFLSWMNQQLLSVDFILVIMIFFVVGFTMFMLPPVPGIAVYICSGIVCSARARTIPAVGFWGGMIVATVESFILKLCAVCGQYYIGYFLGKSVKVQKLVMVDKVGTRAIEKILRVPGLKLPKVTVLVGGPDWPTSVLCGILKLNLFQCLLGTTPVIFVSTPCVIAGAFMANPGQDPEAAEKPCCAERKAMNVTTVEVDESADMWSTMSTLALSCSMLAQLASGIIAMYYIQEVVHGHGDELAKHRKEHEAIAALTRQEAEYVELYAEVSDWMLLKKTQRVVLLCSTVFFLLSVAILMFLDSACFEPFQISSRICDCFDEEGLEGSVFNLVTNLGWMAHILFVSAVILHTVFLKWATKATKAALEEKQQGAYESEDKQPQPHEEDESAALRDAPQASNEEDAGRSGFESEHTPPEAPASDRAPPEMAVAPRQEASDM